MNQGVEILRALAARAAECAADPVNAERAKLYRAVNDRHMVRPVVLLEEIPWNELAKEEALRARCTDPDFAALDGRSTSGSARRRTASSGPTCPCPRRWRSPPWA